MIFKSDTSFIIKYHFVSFHFKKSFPTAYSIIASLVFVKLLIRNFLILSKYPTSSDDKAVRINNRMSSMLLNKPDMFF